jgi:hypothetical protein
MTLPVSYNSGTAGTYLRYAGKIRLRHGKNLPQIVNTLQQHGHTDRTYVRQQIQNYIRLTHFHAH